LRATDFTSPTLSRTRATRRTAAISTSAADTYRSQRSTELIKLYALSDTK
jgi:hypothetical protein